MGPRAACGLSPSGASSLIVRTPFRPQVQEAEAVDALQISNSSTGRSRHYTTLVTC